MEITVYSADVVVPVTAPAVTNGAVAVQGGRILHLGTRDWVLRVLSGVPGVREVHWAGVLLPGLVNAHTHLQYTGMAAVGERQYAGFEDWWGVFDAAYEAGGHDWRGYAAHGAELSLAAGVTGLADVITDAEAVGALHDAGLRGVAYWEVIGWANDRWRAEGLARVEAELDRVPTPPAIGVSPHAPYSLDTEPLLDLPDVARRRGARLHIHLGESRTEEGPVPGSRDESWRNVDTESFQALRRDGFAASATDFVDQLGVLGPDCHIAHGVYLNAHDRDVLRARTTVVALCPRSNRVIGLDDPPVAAYLSEGNMIAVGTDSLASSPSLDLLADVAELYLVARRQGYTAPDLAQRLLRAATLGGATALGMATGPERVGQLQVGSLADLAFVDVPAAAGVRDAIENVVRCGAGRVAATLLGGELRYAAPGWTERADQASGADR
jgi:cytosine/adenosine deaminase-related metal-dependent hydrolase